MKKTLLILIAFFSGYLLFGQSHPNNIDVGLFRNGTNGSNVASSASVEVSFRLKSNGLTYTPLPVGDNIIMFIRAPKTDFDEATDVLNIVQLNTPFYDNGVSMITQPPFYVGGDYVYFPVVMTGTGGVHLNLLTSGGTDPGPWLFAYTFSFSPSKTTAQIQQLRIVDQVNNAELTAANGGVPIFSILEILGDNQLTNTAFITLPVSLINFSGFKNGSKNVLKWTTSNESNNIGFEVQRSTDGVNFSSIGFVNSQATGGNSSAELSYSFDDNSPVASRKNYYRLNQKDIDGKSKTSNVVLINGDKPTRIGIGGIFPNPASTTVNVLIDAPKRDDVTVVLMDVLGKTIRQKVVNVEIGSNTVPVEISSLATGSYMIKVLCKSSDCETAVSKFIKQ